jgi:FKBP-type peptidyl-prolyl cis-trans isomerase
MRILIGGFALIAPACSGSDAVSVTDAGPNRTTIEVTTTIAVLPPESTECEDVPDPADYPLGEIPQTLRPCAIPSELTVSPVRSGVGRPAVAGDTIVVQYTGVRSETGERFDTSYERPEPLQFPLGRGGVIEGWDTGLIGAQAGALLKLDIPGELAYGDEPPPSDLIQPNDALTFMIEVRAVIPPVTPADAPLDVEVEPSIGATGVTTVDVVVGEGAPVELGKSAVVHLIILRGDNEVVLANTWNDGQPLPILMIEGQTLPGVFAGLQGATVGTTRVISMPPIDAFGVAGNPSLGLPASSDLIVIAEVFGVY